MMPPIPFTIDGTLRSLRIIHCIMMASMFFYIYFVEFMSAHESRDLNHSFVFGIAFANLVIIGIAFFFRTKKIGPAMASLQLNPNDVTALQQWRTGALVTAVMMEATVLFGFVLRVMGASLKTSLPFYVVGIGLMLLWWPQRP
jgi:hypothetical protein